MRAALLIVAALCAWGQAQPVGRVWTYSGTPTAGDCTSANYGHIALDISGTTANIYDCKKSSGSAAWVLRTSGGGGGGDVYGGSSLTTAGVVPFVASAGTLTQDTQFTYSSFGAGAGGNVLIDDGAGNFVDFGVNGAGYQNLVSTTAVMAFGALVSRSYLASSNTSYTSLQPLDVKASTTTLQDDTATTGVTKLIVKAGAGQGSGNLQEWQNSGGSVLSAINSSGNFTGSAATLTTPRAINGVNFDGSAAITITANLPTNPTACSAGQYVSDIAADGTLTCGTPTSGLTQAQSLTLVSFRF